MTQIDMQDANSLRKGPGEEGREMSAKKNGKAEQDTGHRPFESSELISCACDAILRIARWLGL